MDLFQFWDKFLQGVKVSDYVGKCSLYNLVGAFFA